MKLFSLALPFALCIAATGLTIPEVKIKARSTWTSLGCYIDNVSGRALPNGETVPGGSDAMANELCQAACQAAGFHLAGTEYGQECWCGNSVENGGGPAPDGNASCSMACKGNSAENCGGSNRLDVFQYDPSSSSISATPSASSTSATTTPPASTAQAPTASGTPVLTSAKRGLQYNDNNPKSSAEWANYFVGYSKIGWGYCYGYDSLGLDPSFEFVPMTWGIPTTGEAPDNATLKELDTQPKNFLYLNEPDLLNQINATTGATIYNSATTPYRIAAAAWQTYFQPYIGNIRASLPNVLWNNVGITSDGFDGSPLWLSKFIEACSGCHFDFLPIHWYQSCVPADGQNGADWFMGNVTAAHQATGLPIWITEFRCLGVPTSTIATPEQEIAFLQAVLPWLDSTAFVEKYAYFGVYEDILLMSDGSGLSAIGKAYATI